MNVDEMLQVPRATTTGDGHTGGGTSNGTGTPYLDSTPVYPACTQISFSPVQPPATGDGNRILFYSRLPIFHPILF